MVSRFRSIRDQRMWMLKDIFSAELGVDLGEFEEAPVEEAVAEEAPAEEAAPEAKAEA